MLHAENVTNLFHEGPFSQLDFVVHHSLFCIRPCSFSCPDRRLTHSIAAGKKDHYVKSKQKKDKMEEK